MGTIPLRASGAGFTTTASKDSRDCSVKLAVRRLFQHLALRASQDKRQWLNVLTYSPLALVLDLIPNSRMASKDQGGKGQGSLPDEVRPRLKFGEREAGRFKHVIPSGSLGLPDSGNHIMHDNVHLRLHAKGGPYRRHMANTCHSRAIRDPYPDSR